MFRGGYTGKILRIDLNQRKAATGDYPEELRRKYLGGRGVAAYFYYNELPAVLDPLSPENKIFFITGPLTGMPVLASTKMQLATRSPDTGHYLCSNSSGNFGPYLKFAGYDGVILEGRASSPVAIVIDDDGVHFQEAGHLRGQKTTEVDEYFKRALTGKRIGVMSIGPAAERGVRIACIQVDGRSFGRGGGRCGDGREECQGSRLLRNPASFRFSPGAAERIHIPRG